MIFVALRQDGTAAGFTQLYPSFSFGDPSARCSGVGRRLLDAAADFGRRAGAIRLTLSTAHTNTAAQALYEARGWRRDEVFRGYHLALS